MHRRRGYTGLWTAYYLKRADPGLRIVVLEAAFAGFGASGRNGGWVTAPLPGSRQRYARGPRGADGVRELERQLRDTVDEVARVCAAEGIEAGLVKGGELSVPPRRPRMPGCASTWPPSGPGATARIVRYLGQTTGGLRVHGAGGDLALGALFSPHCARVQPAEPGGRAGRGGDRAGVALYEGTAVTSIGRDGPVPRPVTSARRSSCAVPRGSRRPCRASTGRCCR